MKCLTLCLVNPAMAQTTSPGFYLTDSNIFTRALNKHLALVTLPIVAVYSKPGLRVARTRCFFMPKPKTKLPPGYGTPQTFVLQIVGLKIETKTIYSLICCYLGANEWCWPSQRKLANDMGYKKADTVCQYIADAVECNLIVKARRFPGTTKNGLKYRPVVYDTAAIKSPLTRGDMVISPPSLWSESPLGAGYSPPCAGGQNTNSENTNKNIIAALKNNSGKPLLKILKSKGPIQQYLPFLNLTGWNSRGATFVYRGKESAQAVQDAIVEQGIPCRVIR